MHLLGKLLQLAVTLPEVLLLILPIQSACVTIHSRFSYDIVTPNGHPMVVIGQPLRRKPRRPYNLLVLAMLAVILLLVVFNLVLVVIRVLDRPGRPSPGELLYATDFGAGQASNADWQQESGQSASVIADGVLQIAIDDINSLYSLLAREFSDLDARVNITVTAATSDYDEYGLLFRFQDAANYYMFKLRSDGAYRVEHARPDPSGSGKTQVDVISEWQISPVIETGRRVTNQVRVIASGDSFQFYVNGAPMPLCLKGQDRRSTWSALSNGRCLSNSGQIAISFRDPNLSDGKLGVGALADSPGLRVAFDNIVVYGPN
jgi:hypothetical protein